MVITCAMMGAHTVASAPPVCRLTLPAATPLAAEGKAQAREEQACSPSLGFEPCVARRGVAWRGVAWQPGKWPLTRGQHALAAASPYAESAEPGWAPKEPAVRRAEVAYSTP